MFRKPVLKNNPNQRIMLNCLIQV